MRLLYAKALPDVASRGGKVAANEKFVHYDERQIARLLHELREDRPRRDGHWSTGRKGLSRNAPPCW